MRKLPILLVLLLLIASSAQALSWAYAFVVWKGNVYEVKLEETIEEADIGKKLGEVETKPHEMTGSHYGNASNYFPIGTNYYAITGTATSKAIAVKDDSHWVKAVFAHKAPFHIMNVLTNMFFIISIILLMLIGMGYYVYRKNLAIRQK